jgi:predicted nucleic acid-binding protein
MSDKYFVDTNILMYAHDKAAGEKHERARVLVEQLWRDRTGVVSTQVLQELTVNLRRKARKPLDTKATREVVADYLTWQVVVNGGESILEALDIEQRYQISFWDALVVQAAQTSGTDVLYSEDISNGQQYGPVRVVNPFFESDNSGSGAIRIRDDDE